MLKFDFWVYGRDTGVGGAEGRACGTAIPYIGTGLSLVAFVVAAITFAYRSRLQQRAEIIKSAP